MMVLAAATKSPGSFLWAFVCLLGLIKCVQIARRPTSHTVCVTGLALVLGGIIAITLVPNVLVDLPDARTKALLTTGAVVAAGVLALAGVVVAIVGMALYPGRPGVTQGRGQAFTALVLGSLLLFAFGWGMRAGMRKGRAQPQAMPSPPSGEWLTFETFNCRIRVPEKPWFRWDASTINPGATVALMRVRPQVSWMLMAQRTGIHHSVMTPDQLADLAQAGLRSGTEAITGVERTPCRLAGMSGVRVRADLRLDDRDGVYDIAVVAHNGYVYQLMTVGPRQNRTAVYRAALERRQAFELIDPARVYRGTSEPLAGTLRSPGGDYELRLDGTAWTAWAARAKEVPGSEVGAIHPLGPVVVVLPVRLGGLDPPFERLRAALLEVMDAGQPATMTVVDGGSPQDLTFAGEGPDADGDLWTFRSRVARRGSLACLVSAWMPGATPRCVALMDDAVTRLHWVDPPAKPPAATAQQAALRVLLLAALGRRAAADGAHADAARAHAAAFAGAPDEPAHLLALAEALLRAQGAGQARELLERHGARFPKHARLQRLARRLQPTRTLPGQPPQTVRAPTAVERAQLAALQAAGRTLLARYAPGSTATGPERLDRALGGWAARGTGDATTAAEISRGLGALFGEHLRAQLPVDGLRWVVFGDANGTGYALHGSPGDIVLHPQSMVAKRIDRNETQFFVALYRGLVQAIEARKQTR